MKPTAMITGASRGIGLATAKRFAVNGHNLVVAARGAAALGEAMEQIKLLGAEVEAVPTDVSRADGAQELVEIAVRRFGRIDVLVNNAGAAPLSPIDQMTDEDFRAAVDVNIAAVFHTTRAAWPIMRDGGGGTIVNVSSVASIDPFPGFAVYGACKAWVNLFTKAVADEGRPDGIRIFAVAPGAVETEMLRGHFPEFPSDQALEPDEVAGVIEQLCGAAMCCASGDTVFVRK
jgi:NAD(P)-dependent dehydrogenase (short-subunit alcohol dehydrogenase family)